MLTNRNTLKELIMTKALQDIAKLLADADKNANIVAPPSASCGGLEIQDGYAIQMLNAKNRVEQGERIIGKKIAFGTPAAQKANGLTSPAFGQIFSHHHLAEGQPISTSTLNAPKLEAEILFVMGEDLQGPGITAIDVLRATEYLMPSFELVSGRIDPNGRTTADAIADNVGIGKLITGSVLVPALGLDLKQISLVLEKNGAVVSSSSSSLVMGSPVNAVVWLVNALAEYGMPLQRGEVVLTGTVCPIQEIAAGDVFTAHFSELGSVTVGFTE